LKRVKSTGEYTTNTHLHATVVAPMLQLFI